NGPGTASEQPCGAAVIVRGVALRAMTPVLFTSRSPRPAYRVTCSPYRPERHQTVKPVREDSTVKLNRFSMLAAALVAGSLALTACGGSSGGTTDDGTSSAPAGGSDKLAGSLNGA